MVGFEQISKHATTLPVEVLSTHHDWLDYLTAGAGLAGIVGAAAASAALWFARRSTKDATRSAAAAERSALAAERSLERADLSLEIARREAAAAQAERERRSELRAELKARPSNATDDEPPPSVIVDVAVSNKGSRAAEHVACNIGGAGNLNLHCCDASGNDSSDSAHGRVVQPSASAGTSEVVRWVYEFPHLGPNITSIRHFRIDGPLPRVIALGLALYHQDLPGTTSVEMWRLHVPEFGSDLVVERVSDKQSS